LPAANLVINETTSYFPPFQTPTTSNSNHTYKYACVYDYKNQQN